MIPGFDTLISAEDLSGILHHDNLVVLDCRYALADIDQGRKEFLLRHIPGAYFMDIGLDLSSPVVKNVTGRHPLPNPEVLAYTLKAAGLNNNSQVVVYDQSNGAYAARAWWLLNWLGHSNVAILDGGFNAWTSKTLPLDNQWPAPKHGNFSINLQTHLTVNKEVVSAGSNKLVDSRDYKRYTGEFEPIDPVAGHIPGAICKPYLDNTDESGYWKSLEFLRGKFEDISLPENAEPIFYCGSGVTACHNIFAYKMATGRHALLYPGSWSEWINYYPAAIGG